MHIDCPLPLYNKELMNPSLIVPDSVCSANYMQAGINNLIRDIMSDLYWLEKMSIFPWKIFDENVEITICGTLYCCVWS